MNSPELIEESSLTEQSSSNSQSESEVDRKQPRTGWRGGSGRRGRAKAKGKGRFRGRSHTAMARDRETSQTPPNSTLLTEEHFNIQEESTSIEEAPTQEMMDVQPTPSEQVQQEVVPQIKEEKVLTPPELSTPQLPSISEIELSQLPPLPQLPQLPQLPPLPPLPSLTQIPPLPELTSIALEQLPELPPVEQTTHDIIAPDEAEEAIQPHDEVKEDTPMPEEDIPLESESDKPAPKAARGGRGSRRARGRGRWANRARAVNTPTSTRPVLDSDQSSPPSPNGVEVEPEPDDSRMQALEALFSIEANFAKLRDSLYVERMTQVERDRRELLDGTHPSLLQLNRLIQLRREKKLDLAKKSLEAWEQIYKNHFAEQQAAIWGNWNEQRALLRTSMLEESTHKRRKLCLEKKAYERPEQDLSNKLMPQPAPTVPLAHRRRLGFAADGLAENDILWAVRHDDVRVNPRLPSQFGILRPEEEDEAWTDLERMGLRKLPPTIYPQHAPIDQYPGFAPVAPFHPGYQFEGQHGNQALQPVSNGPSHPEPGYSHPPHVKNAAHARSKSFGGPANHQHSSPDRSQPLDRRPEVDRTERPTEKLDEIAQHRRIPSAVGGGHGPYGLTGFTGSRGRMTLDDHMTFGRGSGTAEVGQTRESNRENYPNLANSGHPNHTPLPNVIAPSSASSQLKRILEGYSISGASAASIPPTAPSATPPRLGAIPPPGFGSSIPVSALGGKTISTISNGNGPTVGMGFPPLVPADKRMVVEEEKS